MKINYKEYAIIIYITPQFPKKKGEKKRQLLSVSGKLFKIIQEEKRKVEVA